MCLVTIVYAIYAINFLTNILVMMLYPCNIPDEVDIFAAMQLNTVIFDMDGLLIDSEPFWNEAANEVFKPYGIRLTGEQYATTTGLRTKEFVHWWFGIFKIPVENTARAEEDIVRLVMEKVNARGKALPGVEHIFNFFIERGFKIGLASSSPLAMIGLVVDKLGIRNYLQAISSADELPYGKPHPQVYLDCAALLHSDPTQCICFEDSFNGLIAAKAARMKCVIVPSAYERQNIKFNASDLKISSLQNFNELLMQVL